MKFLEKGFATVEGSLKQVEAEKGEVVERLIKEKLKGKSLEEALSLEREKRKGLISRIDEKGKAIKAVKHECAELEEKARRLEQDKKKVEVKLKKEEDDIRELTKAASSMRSEAESFSFRIKNKNATIKRVQKDVFSQKEELAKLEGVRSENQELIARLEKERADKQSLEKKVAAFNREKESMVSIGELRQSQEGLKKVIESEAAFKRDVLSFKKEKQALTVQFEKEEAGLRTELQRVNKQSKYFSEQFKKVRDEARALTDERILLAQERDTLILQANANEKELSELKQKKKTSLSDSEELLQQLELKDREIARLENTMANILKRIDMLSQTPQ